jgi:hypothetical protein
VTDVARQKLARLMAEVEALEESAESLEQKLPASRAPSDPPAADAAKRELTGILERLEEKRSELTRISNACRRPHSNV